jgi:hypothetical protein
VQSVNEMSDFWPKKLKKLLKKQPILTATTRRWEVLTYDSLLLDFNTNHSNRRLVNYRLFGLIDNHDVSWNSSAKQVNRKQLGQHPLKTVVDTRSGPVKLMTKVLNELVDQHV